MVIIYRCRQLLETVKRWAEQAAEKETLMNESDTHVSLSDVDRFVEQ